MERTTLKIMGGACISLAGLLSVVDAQSGRNLPRTDTAPPRPAVESPAGFSESVPLKRTFPRAANDKSSPTAERSGKADTAAESGDDVIRVETDLVTVPVSVLDRSGMYVTDLNRSNFRIFEDGVEQKIAYFGTTEKPFTVILLLDTSPSTDYKIEDIRRAATAFVDQLRAQDTVAVIEFDRNVHVLTGPTNDRSRIYRAINKADFGYGTSLYDAVNYTLRKKLSKVTGRKAIVLFTDGVDTTSENAGYDTTLEFAEEADALIYPIYYDTFAWTRSPGKLTSLLLNNAGTTPEEYALGRRYLVDLAAYTGGRVFQPDAAPGGLTAAFEGIAEELRRQYNIGYMPNTAAARGERKQIRVRVDRPNLVIRARDSYIVASARDASTK
jgi:VWFA-related protein